MTTRDALAGALFAAVAVYAVLVVRDFSGYIGSYPYLALDDSLANVSYSLASVGRYGFLASPLQAPTDIPRNDGLFNYGPWYFYLGAALTWLFGYSLALLRAIHLGVILVAAVAAYWWFRGRSVNAAAAIFGLGVLHCFQVAQWPMVRPDVMVSAFALAAAVCAGLAIRTGAGRYWLVAGFAAASGAFTHLIAWSLVPACAAVLVADEWHRRRHEAGRTGIGRGARNLGLLVAGALAGALAFYASFGFRIADHLATLSAYKSFVDADPAAHLGSANGYFDVVAKHYGIAYDYLSRSGRVLIASSLVSGWLVAIFALWRRPGAATPALSFVLPPVTIWTCYLASLGLYPNFHAGYAILSQVMAIWTGAAVLHAAMLLLEETRARWAAALGTLLAVVAIVSGLSWSLSLLEAPSDRETTARRWVNIEAYLDEILVSVPAGARAWGTVLYGIESPRRIQLVQFAEAARLAARAAPDARASLVPDYIIWGYPENRDSLMRSLAGKDHLFPKLELTYPGERFQLVKVVRASPYGAARVYQRSAPDASTRPAPCAADRGAMPPCVPTVGFYHPATGQWARGVSDASPAKPRPVPAQEFRVGYAASPPPVRADRSVAMDLAAGDYLIGVRVSTTAGEKAARVIMATSGTQAAQTIGELGADFDSAPYASTDTEVFLAHRHAGGALVVSQLDGSADAAIRDVVAFPVRPPHDFRVDRREASFRPMLPLEQWASARPADIKASREPDAFRVRGDDSRYGYQLVSPAVAVGSRSTVAVRLRFSVEQGRVCTGILNGTESAWLVAPTEARQEFLFDSGKETALKVVFANCNEAATGSPRSVFTVQEASFSSDESGRTPYADQLMKFR